MSPPPPPPGGDDLFESRVDRGSWSRFTPSLAALLEELRRPGAARPGPAGPAQPRSARRPGPAGRAGATVLLTAPTPVIDPGDPPRRRGLWRVGRSRRVQASPEAPRVVLTGRDDGVEVSVPTQDAGGGALLGGREREALEALGWQGRPILSRLLPDGCAAAEYTTRILIEILRVPHPADLVHTVQEH